MHYWYSDQKSDVLKRSGLMTAAEEAQLEQVWKEHLDNLIKRKDASNKTHLRIVK